MKTNRIYRRLSFLLMLLMLVQSCRVYKRESVTLDQAISEGKRVKIRTIDNRTYKYKIVEKEDGMYYGVNMKNKEIVRTPLDTNNIRKVKLHDKTMSIIYSSVIGAVVLFAIAVILSFGGPDFNVIGTIQAPN